MPSPILAVQPTAKGLLCVAAESLPKAKVELPVELTVLPIAILLSARSQDTLTQSNGRVLHWP